MTKRDEKMKPLVDRIADLDREIEQFQRRISELTVARRTLADVLAQMRGDPPQADANTGRKPRVANVKGLVLDIMAAAGPDGCTSAEVVSIASERTKGITRDTISSVLSRLKAADALRYDGLRYYDAKHAPRDGEPGNTTPHVRAI